MLLPQLLKSLKQGQKTPVSKPLAKDRTTLEQEAESSIEKSIDPGFKWKEFTLVEQGLHYCHTFVPRETAKLLLDTIEAQETNQWVVLTHAKRRLQKWGGDVMPQGLTNISPIPTWLLVLVKKLLVQGVTAKECNHFLINEYKQQIGIMPHTDGPLYHPYVSIISLGCPILFKFYDDLESFDLADTTNILLVEDSSLFVFEGDFYHKKLHTIEEIGFESFGVEVIIEQTMKGIHVSLGKCRVINFLRTRLFKELFEPSFEPGSSLFASCGSKEDVLQKLKEKFDNKTHEKFHLDLQYDHETFQDVRIIVSWSRDLRVSMTARYVYPAAEQKPEGKKTQDNEACGCPDT